MKAIPLINLNAYVLALDGIDNSVLSSIVLSGKEPDTGEFMVEHNHTYFEDTVLPKCPEVTSLCRVIENSVSGVLGAEYVIEAIWGLVLNQGQSVMMHSHKSNAHLHPSDFYSIAYYPCVPEGSAELIFSLTHCNTVEQAIAIKPEEGMLVIFNSYIPHMTSRHMAEEPRIVISANLFPVSPNNRVVPDWTPYKLSERKGDVNVSL